MQLFKLKTRLSKFDHFADFAREFKLSEHDLVITNEFLYDPFMKSLNLPCHFIMQEKFGLGEPSDKMMNTIRNGDRYFQIVCIERGGRRYGSFRT